jgi:CopG family nickel-responsive transcriptional regulator
MTITLDDELVDDFERYMDEHGYQNRSEAIRDLIRDRVDAERIASDPGGDCLATLTYVYNHHERDLASRLTETHHAHHDLSVATLHVHLDHANCMEAVILRGAVDQVRAFANATLAQPGVRHGNLFLRPVKLTQQTHQHGEQGHSHRHLHVEPIT